MGAPTGHPFFGNQYTNGGYEPGSFTYVYEATKSITDSIPKVASSVVSKDSILREASDNKNTNIITFQDVKRLASHGVNKKTIIIGSAVVVATVGGALIYKSVRKRRQAKKEAELTIILDNVGICTSCGEPLKGSLFDPGDKISDHSDACIVCKHCGEKNYAWYQEENVEETEIEDGTENK